MMYHVSAPEVCGSFDVGRAQLLAQESASQGYLNNGEIHWYNRPAVSLDVGALALHSIELSLYNDTPAPDHGTLYTHDPVARPLGRRWHVDNKDLLVGYSSLPTQFIEGAVDIEPIAEKFSKGLRSMYAQRDDGNRIMVINRMDILSYCVERAIQKGDARVMDPIEPGMVVRIRSDTVHRSFTPDDALPIPRLFMALDLNPYK
jgi:hypothetical protein